MDRIKACFPYPEARTGQLELIEQIVKAYDGGAKNVILDAPTGTGKTPIAITLARYYSSGYDGVIHDVRRHYNSEAALRGKSGMADALAAAQASLAPHQAHMITSMKLLQAQYLDSFTTPLITLMKGKNNYRCRSNQVPPGTSCADYEALYSEGGPCRLSGQTVCAYNDAKFAAQFSRLTLHNFDSFFAQVSLGGGFVPRAVLTIDEAHNAEAKVIDAVTFSVYRGAVLDYGGTWALPDCGKPEETKAWATDVITFINKALVDMQNRIELIRSSSKIAGKEEFRMLRQLAAGKREATETKRKIERYVLTADKPWVMEVKDNGESLQFEPVKGSYFAGSALTKYGARVALLSATILDKNRIISGLNLKYDETFYLAAPCLFPVETRRIVDTRAVDTGKKSYERNIEKMCAEIKRLMDKHPGVRGVIHASSYQMAKDIVAGVDDSRLMSHGSKDRGDVVQAFTGGSKPDAVLVGVYVKEGYDFKHDQCRFQIIPRLPYPYVTQRIAAREEIEGGYYQWLTMIDLIQECGRGTRSEDDMCVTYVIDSRFGDFVRKNHHITPRWFGEAIEIERKH